MSEKHYPYYGGNFDRIIFDKDGSVWVPEAENAKLRELASILCFCMQVHAKCDDCKLNGAKGELAHDPLCACDGLHEILRELGIEVPS